MRGKTPFRCVLPHNKQGTVTKLHGKNIKMSIPIDRTIHWQTITYKIIS